MEQTNAKQNLPRSFPFHLAINYCRTRPAVARRADRSRHRLAGGNVQVVARREAMSRSIRASSDCWACAVVDSRAERKMTVQTLFRIGFKTPRCLGISKTAGAWPALDCGTDKNVCPTSRASAGHGHDSSRECNPSCQPPTDAYRDSWLPPSLVRSSNRHA